MHNHLVEPGVEGRKVTSHVGLVTKHKLYYKGEGSGFPQVQGCGESCEYVFARGSSVH
jgi:hypothetical protein